MVETVTDPQRPEIELPENGRFTLRPYQGWVPLVRHLSHYSTGGILADEMGLGRALQMLTFLSPSDARFITRTGRCPHFTDL